MGDKLEFVQSQIKHHDRLLNETIVLINGTEQLSILIDLNIKHEILLRNGFSDTDEWGTEPFFYMEVIGSESTAYGVAALLGMTFKQDAIGIIYPVTKENQLLLKDFHSYFLVHSISFNQPIEMMQHVRKFCPKLSGQLDILGASIEFHDFDSFSSCTCDDIEHILNIEYQRSFKVTKRYSMSRLLEKPKYQEAINKLGIRLQSTYAFHDIHFQRYDFLPSVSFINQ
jgi:hypothetical protein